MVVVVDVVVVVGAGHDVVYIVMALPKFAGSPGSTLSDVTVPTLAFAQTLTSGLSPAFWSFDDATATLSPMTLGTVTLQTPDDTWRVTADPEATAAPEAGFVATTSPLVTVFEQTLVVVGETFKPS